MVSGKFIRSRTTVPCERLETSGPMRSFAVPMDRQDTVIRAALLHTYPSGSLLIGLNAGGVPCRAWHTDGDYTSVESSLTRNLRQLAVNHSRGSVLYLNDGAAVAPLDWPTEIRPYDCSLLEVLRSIRAEAETLLRQQQQQQQQQAQAGSGSEDDRLSYETMLALDPTMTPAQYAQFRKECDRQQQQHSRR